MKADPKENTEKPSVHKFVSCHQKAGQITTYWFLINTKKVWLR